MNYKYGFIFALGVLAAILVASMLVGVVFANSSQATVIGGSTHGNIFGSVQLYELNFSSTAINRGSISTTGAFHYTIGSITATNGTVFRGFNIGANPANACGSYTLNAGGVTGQYICFDIGAPTLTFTAGTKIMYTALNVLGPSVTGGANHDIYGLVVDMANSTDKAINDERGVVSINNDPTTTTAFLGIGHNAMAFTKNILLFSESMTSLTGANLASYTLTYDEKSYPAITVNNNSPVITLLDLTNLGAITQDVGGTTTVYGYRMNSPSATVNAGAVNVYGLDVTGGSGGTQTGIRITMNKHTESAINLAKGTIAGNYTIGGTPWLGSTLNINNGVAFKSSKGGQPTIVTFTYPTTLAWNATWQQTGITLGGALAGNGQILQNIHHLQFGTDNPGDLGSITGGRTLPLALYSTADGATARQIQFFTPAAVAAGFGTATLRMQINAGAAQGSSSIKFYEPIIWYSSGSTGAGGAALGNNSPAVTLTAPATWIPITLANGTNVYIPAWK